MARLMGHLEHDECHYIDPRLLEQTGGGVNAPQYSAEAQQPIKCDELAVELDIVLADLPHEIDEADDVPSSAHLPYSHAHRTNFASSATEASDRSLLNLSTKGSIFGSSSRPQLFLETEEQEPEVSKQDEDVPITPRIEVQPPEHNSFASNTHGRKTSQIRGRMRRRSSPARRPSQSLVRDVSNEHRAPPPRFGSGERLLSPSTVQRWINGHAYHPGDTTALSSYDQTSAILTNPPSVCSIARSPSVSSQNRRSYYCRHEGCKQAEKAWDTRSELKKHQRVHMPKDQRPHTCPECEEAFWYPKDVLRHIRAKHKGGTTATCPFCCKILSREDNLERHMERQHGCTAQTRSTDQGSSMTSPVSPSVSSFSGMYSDTAPSTGLTSPLSQIQAGKHSFKRRTLLPAIFDDPFMDSDEIVPTSVPMTRGHTN